MLMQGSQGNDSCSRKPSFIPARREVPRVETNIAEHRLGDHQTGGFEGNIFVKYVSRVYTSWTML
jgi:hypothetical protein